MRRLAAILCCLALTGAGLGAGSAAGSKLLPPDPCHVGALRLTFKLIPFSQGAGQVFYRLRVTNAGSARCSLGLATIQLLGKGGARLPSHSRPFGGAIAVAPGKTAQASVKFSPDVAGSGEPQRGPCEPFAYSVRVTFKGSNGSASASVKPPTPVCQHGAMGMGPYRIAG